MITPYDFHEPGTHTFFGYYEISPLDAREERLLACKVRHENAMAAPDVPMTVGYYDLRGDAPAYVPLGQTVAWCWQMGCRLQWLPPFGEHDAVMHNVFEGGAHRSVVLDAGSGERLRTYDAPIYALSLDGSSALTLDFSRLHRLRHGYGYTQLEDATEGDLAPASTGISHLDMRTGEVRQIVSVAELVELEHREEMDGAEHYVNHLLFNPSGTRFMVLHIWLREGKRWLRLVTGDKDGSNLHVLVDDDFVSHYAWKNDTELLCYAEHEEHGQNYYLHTDKTKDYRLYLDGAGAFADLGDGHPSFSPGGGRLLTDTKPHPETREQRLLQFELQGGQRRELASFRIPEGYEWEVRCDFHPRWSPSGRFVVIDSAHHGERSMVLVAAGAGD